MRYPVSGTVTQAVPPNTGTGATGTTTVYSITAGRVFWLRGIVAGANMAAGPVEIYDATAQSTATTHALRLAIPLSPTDAAVIRLEAPGIKFSNNYVLVRMAATGNMSIGDLAVMGYEE